VENSKILVARKDDLAFIQVCGRGSFQNAGTVKSFYQELLQQGVSRFVVDLNECTYLDSTFLGTLTGLGMRLKEKSAGKGKLHIVNVNVRNVELLRNLGLDRLFNIDVQAREVVNPSHLKEVDPGLAGKEESAQQMLEAHENLMLWDAKNIPKFKDVVIYLKEDLGLSPSD
jgi:anti-anti-sigma factor